MLAVDLDDFYRQHSFGFHTFRATILLKPLILMSSTSFDEYLNAGTTCMKFAKMGKIPGRPVTPKVNKGQNTFFTWESIKLIAKINFFLFIA